jgi:hypothetical protein
VRDQTAARALLRVLAGTRLEAVVSPTGQVVLREARSASAQPSPGAVFGRVSDEAGAPLADALLALGPPGATGARRSVLSDAAGNYRLVNVPPGEYELEVTRLGSQAARVPVMVRDGAPVRVDVPLRAAMLMLEALEVRAEREENRERARFESEAGITSRVVAGRQVKILPGFAEADVVRAVEVLPGVISTSDFTSAFNVRGGSADQNLILLDGFPVYNPFHFGGLFSVFNSDAVARAELQAGGFGPEYGGRVSSLLNVESRFDTPDRVRVDAGVSVLATRVLVRAPLPPGGGGDGGSAFVSGRRSYFDRLVAGNPEIPQYYLTDFQGGLRLRTPRGGRITFTGYTGRDVVVYDQPARTDSGTALLPGRIDWRWGNDLAGVHWQQPLSRWMLDARLSESRFRDHLRIPNVIGLHFGSDIRHRSGRLDLSRDLSAYTSVRFGSEGAVIRAENVQELSGSVLWHRRVRGVQSSSWGTVQLRPGHVWMLDGGVRVDGWRAGDTTRLVLAPRVAAKRFLGADRNAALKVSAGRYTQFVHSLRDEETPFSNELWIVADRYVPHVVSDQVQAGAEKFWGEAWYASVEGYYRRFRGLTANNLTEDPNDPGDDVLLGTGRAYGVDFLVRRSAGRVRGWTTVSLLRATRTFPNPLALNSDGSLPRTEYPPVFDRRVDADVVLEYGLARGTELGVRWNLGSGLPYTRAAGQYLSLEYDLSSGRYRPVSDTTFLAVPGPRNGERIPAYHRLDLTVRRTYTRRWGSWTPYLQVLNAYNRKNVMFYEFDYDQSPARRTGYSQFPFLPAVGAEVSF